MVEKAAEPRISAVRRRAGEHGVNDPGQVVGDDRLLEQAQDEELDAELKAVPVEAFPPSELRQEIDRS